MPKLTKNMNCPLSCRVSDIQVGPRSHHWRMAQSEPRKKQAVSFPSLQKLLPVEAVGVVVGVVGVRVVGAVVRRVVH